MKKRLRFFYVIMLVGLAACLFSCNFFMKSGEEPETTYYTVTFHPNNGNINPQTATQAFTEGVSQNLKTIAELGFKRTDYRFTGWAKSAIATSADYNDGASYTATSDITLYAVWAYDPEVVVVNYTVEHYQQNINDDEYTKVDTDTPTGMTGEKTKAVAKTYNGFTAKAFEQETLVKGESKIIKIYYDRKKTSLTLVSNGGQFQGGETDYTLIGRFGSKIKIHMGDAAWPSKSGYILKGWAYSSDATTAVYSQELSFEVTAETSKLVTLYAVWESESSFNNKGLVFSDFGNDIKIVAEGKVYKAVATLQGTYSYEWYLNDVKQDCEESSIDLSQLSAGYYILTVKVTNSATGFVYVSTFENPIVF